MTKIARSLAVAALLLTALTIATAQDAKQRARPQEGAIKKTVEVLEEKKTAGDVKDAGVRPRVVRRADDGPAGRRPRPLPWELGMAISVEFAPDGKTLAVGSDRSLVGLVDPAALRVRSTLAGHPLPRINDLAFSPDGATLATANGDFFAQDRPGEVWLWDVPSGAVRARLRGHGGHVWSVAFSPDGKTLASGSADNTVKLWDLATGKEEAFVDGQTGPVRRVAFSPDGKTLVAGSFDGTIKLWDVATRRVKDCIMAHKNGVNGLAFSPDGKTLATSERLAGPDREAGLKLWDVATLKESHILSGIEGRVLSIAFSPDGRLLATAGGIDRFIEGAGHDRLGELKLWDPATGQLLWEHSGTRRFGDLAFSPDGKSLATSAELSGVDGEVLIWSVAGRQLRPPDRPDPKWAFVNLQPWCNHLLEDDFALFGGNSLRSLPQGERMFGSTKFAIGKALIRLRGNREADPKADLLEKVEGIKVGSRAGRLVFLHGTEFSLADQGEEAAREIGSYVVHFADATEHRIPIVYGRDLSDWWAYPNTPEPTKAEIAWRGANIAAADFADGVTIRVFSIPWTNPHPEKEIATIDFVSKLTACQPFLVALTLEPPEPDGGKK
jgi:WD40 repeat protein